MHGGVFSTAASQQAWYSYFIVLFSKANINEWQVSASVPSSHLFHVKRVRRQQSFRKLFPIHSSLLGHPQPLDFSGQNGVWKGEEKGQRRKIHGNPRVFDRGNFHYFHQKSSSTPFCRLVIPININASNKLTPKIKQNNKEATWPSHSM